MAIFIQVVIDIGVSFDFSLEALRGSREKNTRRIKQTEEASYKYKYGELYKKKNKLLVPETFQLSQLTKRCTSSPFPWVRYLFTLLCRLKMGTLLGLINVFLDILNENIMICDFIHFISCIS